MVQVNGTVSSSRLRLYMPSTVHDDLMDAAIEYVVQPEYQMKAHSLSTWLYSGI